MASYRGHLLGGIGAYLCGLVIMRYGCSLCWSSARLAEWLFCALLGSLLPDVDITSKGQRFCYGIGALISIYLISKGHHTIVAYGALIAVIPLLVGHRTMVHTFWFWVLMGLLLWWGCCSLLGNAICPLLLSDLSFVGLGIYSHLRLDGYRRIILRF